MPTTYVYNPWKVIQGSSHHKKPMKDHICFPNEIFTTKMRVYSHAPKKSWKSFVEISTGSLLNYTAIICSTPLIYNICPFSYVKKGCLGHCWALGFFCDERTVFVDICCLFSMLSRSQHVVDEVFTTQALPPWVVLHIYVAFIMLSWNQHVLDQLFRNQALPPHPVSVKNRDFLEKTDLTFSKF